MELVEHVLPTHKKNYEDKKINFQSKKFSSNALKAVLVEIVPSRYPIVLVM